MSKISIIVPVYNVDEYIKKCIDSIVNQSLKDIQIIIVNDGSTDKSKNIIMEYLKDKRIVYLEKENGGLSSARNYGLPYCDGEYIGFIDSDDYIEKNMYEKMYNKAIEENSDMVECDFYWEYSNKKKKDIGKIYEGCKQAIVDARVVAWNKIIRRDILLESKIQFPEGLRYEDVEFFYKLVPYLKKISFVKEPLVHYIQRMSSIANVQDGRTSEILNVLDNVIEYYSINGLYEKYKDELEYIYARYILCSSLKRMTKIEDSDIKKEVLNEAWIKLNKQFPKWKKNKILNENLSIKKIYMKSVNSITYRIYTKIL